MSYQPIPVTTAYEVALTEFQRVRQQATLQAIVNRFTGQSADLLPYEEVARRLQVTGRAERGRQTIKVDAIVGSVGRYNDFTRTFLPRQKSDAPRWARVRSAAEHVSMLPPIEVYQIGEAYFVLDGNHRVSVARQQGVIYLEAYVTEIRTRVPLSPDDSPDQLIVKYEYADFLAYTGLDGLRPEADLQVTAPGQMSTLENLIEVHRYFIEVEEGQELSLSEAVTRWYDEAYLPVVEAIREQDILRFFPGRTETDFYLWLALHQRELQQEVGWQVPPAIAALRLARSFRPASAPLRQRLKRQLGLSDGPVLSQSWLQEKLLARYSASLFGNILMPLLDEGGENSLELATALAAREEGSLYGLCLYGTQPSTAGCTAEALFREHCERANVPGLFLSAAEDLIEGLLARAAYADLMFLPRPLLGHIDLHSLLDQLLPACSRPVLIGGATGKLPERVLLITNGDNGLESSLFVATYFAEVWEVPLVVAAEGQPVPDHVRHYLGLHELEVVLEQVSGSEAITGIARQHNCDLIIVTNNTTGRFRRQPHPLVSQLLDEWEEALLFCPSGGGPAD